MACKFKLSFITDEVSQDIGEAISFAKHFGITALELRSVDGLSPFAFTDETIKNIKEKLAENQMTVCALSSPLFKCEIMDEKSIAEHIVAFERLAGYAKELSVPFIRGFDFFDTGASLEERAEKYRPIIEICKKYDVTVLIEYDPTLHASTPEKVAEFVDFVNDPTIKALYDPGNGLWKEPDSAPYPTGYDVLKPYIRHIHIKDAAYENGKLVAVKVGDGIVDYKGLFNRLISDGYTGYISLETHYRKNHLLSEELLKLPGGHSFSDGAMEASFESMESLIEILHNI